MLSITSVDVWTFSSCGFDVVTDSSTLIGSIVVVVVFSVVVVVVVVGLRRLLVTETDGEPEEIWFSTGLASTDRAVLDCGLLRRAPGRLPPKDSTPSLAAGISFVSTAIEAAVVVATVVEHATQSGGCGFDSHSVLAFVCFFFYFPLTQSYG